MDLAHVDLTPAPAGVPVSFVESEWHRISAELESERAVSQLADMLDREPSWDDLRLLASVRDVELDQTGRLMRLMATRRVLSFLEGETVRDVVDIVGEREPADVMAERTNRHEVGLALGRTKGQAQFQVAVYRRLVSDFPHFVAALTAGQITLGHCHALHEETIAVTDPEALARIAGKALPFAQSQPTGRFRTSLRRLVAKHDPDVENRRREARRQRRVIFSNLGDGISSMTVVGRTEDVDAVRDLVDDAAAQLLARDRADAADPGRARLTAGQARSDAVIAALLGQVDADGTVTYAPRQHRRLRLELVMDAATAAGIRDNLARLGTDPICAGIARALMVDADVIARALVAEGTAHCWTSARTSTCRTSSARTSAAATGPPAAAAADEPPAARWTTSCPTCAAAPRPPGTSGGCAANATSARPPTSSPSTAPPTPPSRSPPPPASSTTPPRRPTSTTPTATPTSPHAPPASASPSPGAVDVASHPRTSRPRPHRSTTTRRPSDHAAPQPSPLGAGLRGMLGHAPGGATALLGTTMAP
jgi:hypothetical protein